MRLLYGDMSHRWSSFYCCQETRLISIAIRILLLHAFQIFIISSCDLVRNFEHSCNCIKKTKQTNLQYIFSAFLIALNNKYYQNVEILALSQELISVIEYVCPMSLQFGKIMEVALKLNI